MDWIIYSESTPVDFNGNRRQYIEYILNILKIEQPENYTANTMYAMEYVDTIPETTNAFTQYRLCENMFITINPYPDYEFKKFIKKMDDFVKRKTITNYVYVIEQRGTNETECGKGFHAHILFQHNYDRISHFDRDIKSTFKSVCDTKKYQCLNIKSCEKDIDIPNRIEYMLGEKEDQAGNPKRLKQQFDTVMRRNNRINKYYSNGYENNLENY